MIKNWDVPIYNAIKQYCATNPTPFHMPGHKLGKGIPKELLGNLGLFDITEIPGMDNLNSPQGVIDRAQKLAAGAFGADETFFLVNGSTCGIQAIIMTICKPGDKLIVSRDCHKSVISGMMLAGVTPVYLRPEFDKDFGISTTVLPSTIERAIIENPDAVGVLITRPNYYGICSDIEKIASIIHSYGKVLAVDEAHGAHLKFHKSLPVCAMEGGADICVQSAHKTLPALTQGAYLHARHNAIDIERLKFSLSTLQTSSPSYIMMTFLDMARAIMEEEGEKLLEGLLSNIKKLKIDLLQVPGLRLLSDGDKEDKRIDNTRIVINVKELGKTGFEVENILREQYGIQVEMSDLFNIVCIATIADRQEDFEKLVSALGELSQKFKNIGALDNTYIEYIDIPVQMVTPRDIMSCSSTSVKFDEAAGKVSRSIITPYPPGIPVICPGEVITDSAIRFINQIIDAGGNVNGLDDNKKIMVIE